MTTLLPIPRPHQNAVLVAAADAMGRGQQRGKIIQPCGAGKTLTGLWLSSLVESRTVAIVVPTLALIEQTIREWKSYYLAAGLPARLCAVCSDHYISNKLDDAAIRSSTDPAILSQILKDNAANALDVFVTTYHSVHRLAEAANLVGVTFDTLIVDEAHRTVGFIDKHFGSVVSDQTFPAKRRFFFTATERDAVSNKPDGLDTISMSREDLFGPYFGRMNFRAAITATPPVLCDYKIVTIEITNVELERALSGSGTMRTGDDTKVSQSVMLSAIALEKAALQLGVKKVISYHNSVTGAEVFADFYASRNAQVSCSALSHKTTAKERRTILSRFEPPGSQVLVSNVRCLSEGIDVPSLDGVLFCDPRGSFVDIVQGVGRALRPSPGKEWGYIIVPIIEGTEKSMEADGLSRYEPLLNIVRALGTVDERMRSLLVRNENEADEAQFKPVISITHNSVAPIDVTNALFAQIRLLIRGRELFLKRFNADWYSFSDAKLVLAPLRLKNGQAYAQFVGNHYSDLNHPAARLPLVPSTVYAGIGWSGWGDYLGSGARSTKQGLFRSFDEAMAWARQLGIKTKDQWGALRKSGIDGQPFPRDIPVAPNYVYKDKGWNGWPHFLGTDNGNDKPWPTYESLQAICLNQGITTKWEYQSARENGNRDIPSEPHEVYPEFSLRGGWPALFGRQGRKDTRDKYPDYSELVRRVRAAGITSREAYKNARGVSELLGTVPSMPEDEYAGRGWVSWSALLGKPQRIRANVSYADAQAACQRAKITSIKQYRDQLPHFLQQGIIMPPRPENSYNGKGWVDWPTFFGVWKNRPAEGWPNFLEFSQIVRSMGIRTREEYFLRHKESPRKMPSNPNMTYADDGWVSWTDIFFPSNLIEMPPAPKVVQD